MPTNPACLNRQLGPLRTPRHDSRSILRAKIACLSTELTQFMGCIIPSITRYINGHNCRTQYPRAQTRTCFRTMRSSDFGGSQYRVHSWPRAGIHWTISRNVVQKQCHLHHSPVITIFHRCYMFYHSHMGGL